MASTQPFSASSLNMELSITATASSAAAIPGAGNSLRLVNEGPNICYVAVGAAGVVATVATGTAAATCTPVLPGADIVLSRNPVTELYISAICDTTKTATLHVASGEGL